MPYVVFKNKGVIDTRFITSFGVSAKECKSPIGFFGTGLKYAIAVLVREHQELVINAGLETLFFTKRQETLRNKDFEFIDMFVNHNRPDQPPEVIAGVSRIELPFTTEFGKKWEMWQVFRELFCNCRDEEDSEIFVSDEAVLGEEGYTIICVEGDDFMSVYNDRNNIVLEDTTNSVYDDLTLDILPKKQENAMYFRGIRAGKLERPAQYTYNVLHRCDLTEDRTIKYPFEFKNVIAAAVIMSDRMPREVRETILTAPHDSSFEHSIDFNLSLHPCDEFLELVGELRLKSFTKLNPTALAMYRKHRQDYLSERDMVPLTPMQQEMLNKAKEFCLDGLGCLCINQYPIIVTEMDENLYGCVKDGKIFLNTMAFRKGMKQLVTTLWEEYLHAHKGLDDFDRKFQDYLLETAITFAEEKLGKPL